MQKLAHDAAVHFREQSYIIAKANEKARERGMNLSELLRAALRREVLEPQA